MTRYPQPQKPHWKIDPSIDINRVSLEDVKLIFSQAEKRLADTIKRGESIESKTMTMVSLMTGTLITLCGYVISTWNDNTPVSNKAWVAILGIVYILGISIYLLKNVLTNRQFMLGSESSNLMRPSYFSKNVQQDKILLFLYMSEIENYNFRIQRNLEENTRNLRRFRLSMRLLLILPVFLGIAFKMIQWLN